MKQDKHKTQHQGWPTQSASPTHLLLEVGDIQIHVSRGTRLGPPSFRFPTGKYSICVLFRSPEKVVLYQPRQILLSMLIMSETKIKMVALKWSILVNCVLFMLLHKNRQVDKQIHSDCMETDIKNCHMLLRGYWIIRGSQSQMQIIFQSISFFNFGEFRGSEKVATLKTVFAGDTPIPYQQLKKSDSSLSEMFFSVSDSSSGTVGSNGDDPA